MTKEKDKTIIKRTAKRNKPIELPAVMTKIYQPNRVTNSQKPFTLTQSKIFAYVMLQLQEPIKAGMGGIPYHQLDMFSNPDLIKIKIPLKEIATNASAYRDVKKAIRDLAGVVVTLKYNDNGKAMERYTGLIRADIPEEATYNSVIVVEIEKRIADFLITVDKNESLQPINFTTYYFETILRAKSIYTPRLYPLISSWAKKGAFSILMDDLKDILSIPDKYPRFFDFKKLVLEPVQADIYEKANCWFNCNVDGFKTSAKGKIKLNFKIITPEFKNELSKKDEMILSMLTNHFQFKQEHIKIIEEMLRSDELSREALVKKISELDDFIYKNNTNPEKEPITNRTQYALTSIMRQFGYDKTD